MPNTIPTVHVLAADVIAGSGHVTVTFAGAAGGGTLTTTANTVTGGAVVAEIGTGLVTVTPGNAGSFGHVDLQLIDGNGELGTARVVFLIPVTFS